MTIQKANELTESFKTQTNEGRDNLKTLESMSAEIERLSKGVDAFGENISLDTSDYERYKKITEEIVKLQPEVTEYREVDGELIANNTLLLAEAIEKQKEYNQSIIDGAEARGTEVFKGLGNQIQKAQSEISKIMSPFWLKDKSLVQKMIGDAEGIFYDAHFDELIKIFDELNIAYTNNRKEGGFLVADAESLVANEKELLSALETRLNLQSDTKQEIKEQITLIKEQLSVIEDAKKAAADYLKTWVQSTSNKEWYDQIQSGYLGAFQKGLEDIYKSANMTGAQAKVAAEDLGKAFVSLGDSVPAAEIEELQKKLAEGAITSEQYAAMVEKIKQRLIDAGDGSTEYAAAVNLVVSVLGGFADAQERARKTTGGLKSEIEEATDKIADFSDALKTLQDTASLVSDLMENGITAKNLEQIIKKYADLDDEVAAYLVGLMSEAELIDIVMAKHDEDRVKFEESAQAKLLASEAFYQSLLENESDLLNELADKYGLDLTNYIDVLRSRLIAHGEATGEMAMASAGLITELARQYGIDIDNFTSAEEFKAAMAAAINRDIESATADGIIALAEKYGVDITNFTEALKAKLLANGATQVQIEAAVAGGIDNLSKQYKVDVDNFASAEEAKLAIAAAANAQLEADFQKIRDAAAKYTPKLPKVSGTGERPSGGAAATKAETEALKAQKDAINDTIKEWQDMETTLKEFHKGEIDRLKERQRQTAESYKKQEERVKSRYDKEIKALRDLKGEYDREDAAADYRKSREELELEKAELQKKTGREAVERIKEIDKSLAELDEKERRRQRDVDIDEQIAAIEEKRDRRIRAIQKEAEAEQAKYEQDIDLIEELTEVEKEYFKQKIDGLKEALEALQQGTKSEEYKKAYDKQKKELDGLKDKTGSTTSAMDTLIAQMYTKATQHSANYATSTISDFDRVYAAYQRIIDAMDEAIEKQSKIKAPSSSSSKSSSSSSSGIYFPSTSGVKISSLDTGGYMLSDGLIYAHRGEAVVREDITEGLLETIDLVRQMSAQTNYSNVSNSYDNRSSVSSVSNPSYGGDTYNSYKIDVHLDNVSFPSEATKLSAHDRLNQLSRDMTRLIGQLP